MFGLNLPATGAYAYSDGVILKTGTFGNGMTCSAGVCQFTVTLDTQSTTSAFPIPSTDAGAVVNRTNASGGADTIVAATTSGYTSGFGFTYHTNSFGNTLTPATSTISGLSAFHFGARQSGDVWSDGANYHVNLYLPVPGAQTGATMLFDDMVWRTLSGDCTNALGAITCTKTGGTSFGALATTTPGTGVATASANTLSAAGGLTTTIASGTSALGTSAISSAACATVVTTAATNTATTDVVLASFNGDPTGVTGYVPATTGMLTIIPYPTSGNVNFKVCNNTSGSITPGAITLNWRVLR
jgi:hypothetical protein